MFDAPLQAALPVSLFKLVPFDRFIANWMPDRLLTIKPFHEFIPDLLTLNFWQVEEVENYLALGRARKAVVSREAARRSVAARQQKPPDRSGATRTRVRTAQQDVVLLARAQAAAAASQLDGATALEPSHEVDGNMDEDWADFAEDEGEESDAADASDLDVSLMSLFPAQRRTNRQSRMSLIGWMNF